MKIRLVLADDHRMFREVLRLSLSTNPELEVVAEAGTGGEALECVSRDKPDVLVLDIALPDGSGISFIQEAKRRHPQLRILILSGYAEKVFVDEALKAGANAYVVKSAGTEELHKAIQAITLGQVYLSPEVVNVSVRCQDKTGENSLPPSSVLGPREKEVLSLLAKGLRANEVASHLGIATATVEVHKRNLKKKLGLSSPAELTRYAIREGLQSISN
ncbi:MAG TPA: response regulator transcription factor [Rhodocyclaceae bacterium]|jgi:two-component system NarL family response regulator